MSTTNKQQINRWIEITGWSFGDEAFPTADTVPSITTVEDHILEGEIMALVKLPEWGHTTGTITTVASTPTYSTITDIMDRRVIDVNLTLASGDEVPLEYRDYTQLIKEAPGWEDAATTGRPQCYTIKPEDGSIGLYPVPDTSYTVNVLYEQQPKKFAQPNDREHFISNQGIPATGSSEVTINAVDMRNAKTDRPRKLLMTQWVASGATQADGAMTATGTIDVSSVAIEDRSEALDWGDDSAAGSGSLATYTYEMNSTLYFTELDSIVIGAEAGDNSATCSVGTGAFDTTVYTQNSHLPDNFALEVGPYHAAYLWAKAQDNQEKMIEWKMDRDNAIERLVNEYASTPNSKLFAMKARWERRR